LEGFHLIGLTRINWKIC